MVRATDGLAAGQLLRRIQTQPYHRNPRRLEYRQNIRADAYRVRDRMLTITPLTPQLIQRRITDNDRRINANRIRRECRDTPRRFYVLVVGRPRKPGHHLQHKPQSRRTDKRRRTNAIRRAVTAPGGFKHPVVHRLAPKLHRLDMTAPQPHERLRVHSVRSCGQAHGRDNATLDIGLRRVQQRILQRLRHGGEAPAVKRELRPACPLCLRRVQRRTHIGGSRRQRAA